jgi:asparagine synthase (glutamine-hydrolysing)
MGSIDGAAAECRDIVGESIHRNVGDSILLSGGLDTSIIAHVVAKETSERLTCFTVSFQEEGVVAPDVQFARAIAKELGLDWRLLELTSSKLPGRLAGVVRVLRTFDPMEVRNSVVVYHGMAAAQELGLSKVMTGDAADELFAGYDFSFKLPPEQLPEKLRGLWKVMRFSSVPIARALHASASLPYLDPSVVRFAEKLAPGQLVGARDERKYGKLILRVAFEALIGETNAWRVKTPIEYGSGTTCLPEYYRARIRDDEFLGAKREAAFRDGVEIRDKEHLEYYRIYLAAFPPPSALATTEHRCPSCGADVTPSSTFCVTCGAYPIAAVAVR